MKRNKVVGAVHITLDTDRLDKNLRNAQKKLDMQVLNDTNEYVPMDVGALPGECILSQRSWRWCRCVEYPLCTLSVYGRVVSGRKRKFMGKEV